MNFPSIGNLLSASYRCGAGVSGISPTKAESGHLIVCWAAPLMAPFFARRKIKQSEIYFLALAKFVTVGRNACREVAYLVTFLEGVGFREKMTEFAKKNGRPTFDLRNCDRAAAALLH
jgi:hypothetical protein